MHHYVKHLPFGKTKRKTDKSSKYISRNENFIYNGIVGNATYTCQNYAFIPTYNSQKGKQIKKNRVRLQIASIFTKNDN